MPSERGASVGDTIQQQQNLNHSKVRVLMDNARELTEDSDGQIVRTSRLQQSDKKVFTHPYLRDLTHGVYFARGRI